MSTDTERLDRKRKASRERIAKLRAADPEKFRERARLWREKNRDRSNEQARRSHQKSYWANPEKARATKAKRRREAYQKNPDRFKENQKRRRLARLEEARAYDRKWRLKRDYGLTLEARDAMLSAQGGRCAICGTLEPGNKLGWHVDHCHTTKKVRAILCHNCNCGLGHAKDSPEILMQMIAYLQHHSATHEQPSLGTAHGLRPKPAQAQAASAAPCER